jgi:hypothetical protein
MRYRVCAFAYEHRAIAVKPLQFNEIGRARDNRQLSRRLRTGAPIAARSAKLFHHAGNRQILRREPTFQSLNKSLLSRSIWRVFHDAGKKRLVRQQWLYSYNN